MANRQRDAAKERLWRAHLAAWRRSGLSIRAYCRQHTLSEPSFYAWRRTLDRRRASPTSTPRAGGKPADNTPSLFVPIRLVDEPATAGVIEVVVRGGHVIRVAAGFSPTMLRQVIAAVEQRSC